MRNDKSDKQFCVNNAIYCVLAIGHWAEDQPQWAFFKISFLQEPVIQVIVFFLEGKNIPTENFVRMEIGQKF